MTSPDLFGLYPDGTKLFIIGNRVLEKGPLVYRGPSPLGGYHLLETKDRRIDLPGQRMDALTPEPALACARGIVQAFRAYDVRWRSYVTDEDYALALSEYPEMLA